VFLPGSEASALLASANAPVAPSMPANAVRQRFIANPPVDSDERSGIFVSSAATDNIFQRSMGDSNPRLTEARDSRVTLVDVSLADITKLDADAIVN